MATNNIDFLKFSAYSIKDYITRKLSENSKFTDQVYEGSNLAVLIDVVSYMYQCMMYQLNNAASESMWSDTQIYENISRLSKILGYSPKGIKPSNGLFFIDNTDPDTGESGRYGDITVPRYACIDSGKVDSNGNRIYYSTIEDFSISRGYSTISQRFYNGIWKAYGTVFTATGDDYESYILIGVGSDIENKKYVANNMVDVYIESIDSDGEIKLTRWERTDEELFTDSNATSYGTIFDNNSQVFNLRLNEDKNYEIKFGDGVIGKKLNVGDKIYIFYLDTNGDMGKLDSDDMPQSGAVIQHSSTLFGISSDLYDKIFSATKDIDFGELGIIVYQNLPTSDPVAEESVDDIRISAPNWFKLGKRLVTAADYKYFIMNINGDTDVIDCSVQNNWEYTTTFYRWLYELGLSQHDNERYYLNENRLIKNDYKFSDASDANNVYIWTKLRYGDIDSFSQITQPKLKKLKTMTSEVVFLSPITVNFAVCAAPEDRVMDYILSDDDFDELNESYIEVTLDNNSLYVTSEVQSKINEIINDFFDETKMQIGQNIVYADLLNQIYTINGIKRIRTVYQKRISSDEIDESVSPVIKDGISFATWSTGGIIDEGDDLYVGNISRSLEAFQFPQLYTTELNSRIKVIKKSVNNINSISY